MNLLNYIIVFLISMVPLIELRGAIPYANIMELNIVISYILAVLGNFLIVPPIFLYLQRFLEWGKNKKVIAKFCKFAIKKGKKASKKIQEKIGDSIYLALFLFIAIPFPGTGAWTGTLAASFLKLDFKKTIITVACALVTAAIIMQLMSSGVIGIFK